MLAILVPGKAALGDPNISKNQTSEVGTAHWRSNPALQAYHGAAGLRGASLSLV